MARLGNQDRGLYCRTYPSGKTVWMIRFAWEGRDIRLRGGTTKEQARRTLHATLTDLERGTLQLTPTQTESVAGALARYQPWAERGRNAQKMQCFFAFWTAQLGKVALLKVLPEHIEQAQAKLLQCGKSPATVNRYTDFLRHVFNREIRLGRLHRNPVTRITRLHEPDAPIHQYSPAQEAALMKALGESGPWVRLAILTGLRQAEQFSIRKDWIHWSEGYLQIPTSKANRPRVVLLTEEIRAIVTLLAKRHPLSPFLFPSPKYPGRPMDPGNWYRRVFKPALLTAKIPAGLHWHSLRHTFGSRLAASGASSKQIQALGGWSTEKASSRYIHLTSQDLMKVAERLSGTSELSTMPKTS